MRFLVHKETIHTKYELEISYFNQCYSSFSHPENKTILYPSRNSKKIRRCKSMLPLRKSYVTGFICNERIGLVSRKEGVSWKDYGFVERNKRNGQP